MIITAESGVLADEKAVAFSSTDFSALTGDDMKETILYGLPKGATERWEEVVLLTNATLEKIKKVKIIAARDGFHSFRTAVIDLTIRPDFTKAVKGGK